MYIEPIWWMPKNIMNYNKRASSHWNIWSWFDVFYTKGFHHLNLHLGLGYSSLDTSLHSTDHSIPYRIRSGHSVDLGPPGVNDWKWVIIKLSKTIGYDKKKLEYPLLTTDLHCLTYRSSRPLAPWKITLVGRRRLSSTTDSAIKSFIFIYLFLNRRKMTPWKITL